jgi:hypothetical protein
MLISNEVKREFKKAQKEYIDARLDHQVILDIERRCKQKVLIDNIFYTEDTSEIITSYKSDFRMSENDFITYCKLVFDEEKKMGLDVPNWETAATYKTFEALKKVEDNLLSIGLYTIPEAERESIKKAFNHWKHRYEVLALMEQLNF